MFVAYLLSSFRFDLMHHKIFISQTSTPQSVRSLSINSPGAGNVGIGSRHSSGSHAQAAKAFEDYINFADTVESDQEFDQDDDDMEE